MSVVLCESQYVTAGTASTRDFEAEIWRMAHGCSDDATASSWWSSDDDEVVDDNNRLMSSDTRWPPATDSDDDSGNWTSSDWLRACSNSASRRDWRRWAAAPTSVNFGLWKKSFLSENFRPKMQNYGLKPFSIREYLAARLKF